MKEIQGKTCTIQQLLSGNKYGIDYYQREYQWQSKHMAELVHDLTGRFLEDYNPNNHRKEVGDYGHYFLGSIITSQQDNQKMIVDGQQRLTSLILLLIYLHNLQKGKRNAVSIEQLIVSEDYGEKSFNLNVPERNDCMEALFQGNNFDPTGKAESLKNLVGRYEDIEENFPYELREKALPYFVDWLRKKVQLVEITASSDDDAYTIFETVNNRGLSLSNTDMLKGYLLASIDNKEKREQADKSIKQWLLKFAEQGKDKEADFFKTWLRSQYVEKSVRDRKKETSQDFEGIGESYYRWVRNNAKSIGLTDSEAFYEWVTRDLDFYAQAYLRLLKASKTYTEGLESLFYNEGNIPNLQYQLLLAPLQPSDDAANVNVKLKLVADYIDCWLNRRLWNSKLITYDKVAREVFKLTKELRRLSLEQLREKLVLNLRRHNVKLNFSEPPRLNQRNRTNLKRLLARLIDWVEKKSDLSGNYTNYIKSSKSGYEIEHIWADKYERHKDEFDNQEEFSEYRNRLGGLLLLPKKNNASLKDKDYDYKVEHYLKENLLAKSLHQICYENAPGFLQMIERTGLPFKPYYKANGEEKSRFKKADLKERSELYRQIAEQVWSVTRLQD